MLKIINNIIFPKSCLICNKIIKNGLFCFDHWRKINFITKPYCKICHLPFEYKIDNKLLCGGCLAKKPHYKKLVAACKYDDELMSLIVKFKFFDQSHLSRELYQFIFPKLEEFITKIDFIVPVPLHKKRLKDRKYNQALFLAKFISKKSKIKLLPDLLIRSKEGKNQIGLNKRARIENVKNAFELNRKYQDLIQDKNILLIDDVVTTGATINNCSKVLKKNVGDIFVGAIGKRML